MTIFKKIIDGEIPSKIIYEDDQYLAFLDISQVSKGHSLVIPKNPTVSVLTADEKTVGEINILAQKIAKQLMQALNAKGVNILSNANTVAGQTVDHYHVHIIPRYEEDELVFKTKPQDIDIEEVYKEIKEKLVF